MTTFADLQERLEKNDVDLHISRRWGTWKARVSNSIGETELQAKTLGDLFAKVERILAALSADDVRP